MIQALIDFLRTLTTPERLIQLLTTVFSGWLGYALLFGIVYAETGLLTGFFLPGDSFLFTVGVVAGAGELRLELVWAVLMSAGILGDSTGYWLGRRTGPVIFRRPDSRFFKREHLLRSKHFYEKYGGRTIVIAKFLPILRTFVPFLAGVSQMRYRRFLAFSVSGVVFWVASLTTLGYALGGVPLVRRHFEKVILLIITLSLIPVISESLKARRRKPAPEPVSAGPPPPEARP